MPLREREQYREAGNELPTPSHFWVGKDFVTAQSGILVPGYNKIEIMHPDGSLPPRWLGWNEHNALKSLGISGRSRGAHMGVNPLYVDKSQGRLLLAVEVLGGRNVALPHVNTRIARHYSPFSAKEIAGETLYEIAKQRIQGHGYDWSLVDSDHNHLPRSAYDKAAAVGLRIGKRRWAVAPGEEPIAVFDEEIVDFRQHIESEGYLVQLDPQEQPDFWIGETAAEVNWDGFRAVFDQQVKSKNRVCGQQINSQLAMGEVSNGKRGGWKLRVEVTKIGNVSELQTPNEIEDTWTFVTIYPSGA